MPVPDDKPATLQTHPCRSSQRRSSAGEEKSGKSPDKRKVKEIRLNLQMEDHDRDTKQAQAERILKKGDSVKLVIQVHGTKEAQVRSGQSS